MRRLFLLMAILSGNAFGQQYAGYPVIPTVPVSVANGGTGSTTASGARTNLGTAKSGANSDITSLTKIGQSGITFNDSQGTPNNAQLVAPSTITSNYSLILPNTLTGVTAGAALTLTANQISFTSQPPATNQTVINTASNIMSKQEASLVCDTNQAMSGETTCDGQTTFAEGVLLVNQTDPTQNGFWVTSPGAWGRGGNMPDNTYTASGALVSVATGGGTTYDQTLWFVNGDGSGTIHPYQIPVTGRIARPNNGMGTCTVSSTALSTTATNETCTGVPASTAVAVWCSGNAAFTTPTAGGLYCRATGTVNQIACNTIVANVQAMAFSCMWMKP